jgi:NADH-quinone oxidoreductase subunit N
VLNSVVSLYYYVRVMQAMFIKQADVHPTGGLEVTSEGALTYSMGAKLFIFAFLIPTIVFGVYFTPIVDFSGQVIRFFTTM